MSGSTEKTKVITIEAVKSGFVVCKDRLVPGKINDWYAFSSMEGVIDFVVDNIDGKES
jgi:hypothetical protein